ncbi:MAG: GNAT family N-acetyltransferase [Chloroflexota bacterium]
MTTVELRPIDRDNYRQATALTVAPEQENYVAPNLNSLADAYVWYDIARCDGIFAGEEMVGFTMYTKKPTESGKWIIVRYMIDHRQQGKGYGRAGLNKLIEQFKAQLGCDRVYLSVIPENVAAKSLYESA